MTFSLVALWVAVKKRRSKDKINKGEKSARQRGEMCAESEGGLCTTDTFYSFSASVESKVEDEEAAAFFFFFSAIHRAGRTKRVSNR